MRQHGGDDVGVVNLLARDWDLPTQRHQQVSHGLAVFQNLKGGRIAARV